MQKNNEEAGTVPSVVGQLADLGGSASNHVGRGQRSDEPLQLHTALKCSARVYDAR
jgi:hypothetical protein